jgi:hypothetical protein
VIAALLVLGLALPAPSPPPADSAAWRVVKSKDGVTLKEADSGDPRAPWGLGEGEIAAPIERVIAHLTDFPGMTAVVPRLETVQVLEQRENSALVYYRFDLPWPISDRDWALSHVWQRDGGRWRMQWVDENARAPNAKRVVRVSPMRGYWELSVTERGTTWARYVFLAQLGGSLPRSVIEQTVWKQPYQTLIGIRKALKK